MSSRYIEQQKFLYALFRNMEKRKELLPTKVSFLIFHLREGSAA
jgi:hypothetical protein